MCYIGGKAVLFDGSNVTVYMMKNSTEEYIILNDSETLEKNEKLQPILKYLKQTSQRPIPLQEIAVAVVSCSCSKDCNPKFNRAANLVKKSDKTFTCGEALVLNTQSQATQMEIKEESEVIVPQSYEPSLHCPPSFDVEASGSGKREGEALSRSDATTSKFMKIDDGDDEHRKR